jgi:hypothetical protein
VYAAKVSDPKSQFRLYVVNVGTMSCDRICPQTATMQEGMFIEHGSLLNFESVVTHYVFVCFQDFSSGITS